MTQHGYAAPDLLAETEWLAAHLDDPSVRVIDADEPPAYRKGHIPGAVGVPDQRLKSEASPVHVLEPDALAALMGPLGVGDDSLVVAYDSNRSLNAARLWWVLGYHGHNVKVLNGGWRKWCAEERPIEASAPTPPANASAFTSRVQRPWLSTVDDLRAAYDRPDAAVWDIRSVEEYTGGTDRGNARRGHIPGARHLEWTNLVNASDHTFKDAGTMREMLEEIGVTADKTVYTY